MNDPRTPADREWFRDAFDELYLTVYRHRDPDEAARILGWLGSHLSLGGARVLDLACGAGRFREPVLERGAAFYAGLDLSMPLLAAARDAAGPESPRSGLVRADMRRVPVRGGAVDVVLSMFTSFGYFEDDADNRGVLGEIARVLRPDGRLVLDLMNPIVVRRTLVPESTRELQGHEISERREIRNDRVVKHVRISPRTGGSTRRYLESVRLVPPATLGAWSGAVGLVPAGSFGDYDGGRFEPDSSPRLIQLFRKDAR